jgi:WD40 repeat protein
VSAIAWSPDGKRLATACKDCRICIWDAESGQRQAILEGHTQYIQNLAFNHAGNLLASSSFEGLIRLWSPDSGRQVASHPGGSWQLLFGPDDRYLLGWQNVSRYGSLEVAYSRECRLLYVHRAGVLCSGPDFSADGRILAAGTEDRVGFWDALSGKEIGSFLLTNCDAHIFHPDGRSLVVTDRLGGVRLRSLERLGGPASSAFRLGQPRRFYDAQMLCDAALSLDGRHLAVAHQPEGESFIFDLQDPSAKPVVLRPDPRVGYIAISPDSHWAATSSWHHSLVKVWDARSGSLVRTLPMPARTTVAFSPDGRWLATSTTEYQLWGVGTWQPKGPPMPGQEVPEWNFTAFSPDGRVIARTTEGISIQLLETLTAKPLATLEAPGSIRPARFQFSPDGSLLAVLQGDQQVQLWDLRLIRQELAELHLDWDMPPYPAVEKGAAAGPVTLEVEPDPSSPAPTK